MLYCNATPPFISFGGEKFQIKPCVPPPDPPTPFRVPLPKLPICDAGVVQTKQSSDSGTNSNQTRSIFTDFTLPGPVTKLRFWVMAVDVTVGLSFSFGCILMSLQAVHIQFNVSLFTSVSLLSGSATSSASTKNLRKFMAGLHSILPVNTTKPLPGIVCGNTGLMGERLIAAPAPFTLYFTATTFTAVARLFLTFI